MPAIVEQQGDLGVLLGEPCGGFNQAGFVGAARGRETAFRTAFGASINDSGARQVNYKGSVQGHSVALRVRRDDGAGGTRIGFIDVQPASGSWDASKADAMAKAFLPPDANYVKDMQVPDFGVEHIYRERPARGIPAHG